MQRNWIGRSGPRVSVRFALAATSDAEWRGRGFHDRPDTLFGIISSASLVDHHPIVANAPEVRTCRLFAMMSNGNVGRRSGNN